MLEEESVDFFQLYSQISPNTKEEESLLFIIKEILYFLDIIDIFSKMKEKK